LSEDKSKLRKTAYAALVVPALFILTSSPAYGVNKETLQMMQQLDTLQQMVQNLQKTVDTQTAVLRTLVEQANDKVNAMKSTVEELQKSTEKNLATSNARLDTMTNQIQALSESLDEAKSRLARLSEQLAQTQNIIQTLSTPPATPAGGTPGGPAQVSVPDADTLYKSGLSAYNSGQYPIAIQAFQDYLKYYGDTDLASNAQFYIGDCYYSQKNYTQAVEEYNKCLERYPNGNKLPAAQLKKGYALLAQDQKAAGIRELRSLAQRYPDTHEAALAAQKLRTLGIVVHVRAR
jgi:tol-pal system protein YbgF